MSPGADSGNDLIPNVLSQETGQSSFACSHCRRQKVKCDRLLPQCGNCTKSNRVCNYPLTVQKPGPKAGTHRRPRVGAGEEIEGSSGLSGHANKKSRTDAGSGTHGRLSRSSIDGRDFRSPQNHRDSISSHSKSPNATHHSGTVNPLYRIVHPSHEPVSDEPSAEPNHHPTSNSDVSSFEETFSQACHDLGVSGGQGRELISLFFENFTAFSLFHRPTFEQKMSSIASLEQLKAFLSAIFAFALRFIDSSSLSGTISVPRKSMLDFAYQLHLRCLELCFDDDPPLHLLQSYLLITFQKLIHGVRGKAWRMLGDCVRIAYEIKLHLIDARSDTEMSNADTIMSEDWVGDEEKRRLWWAIWECDVFASTIRRLPSGIDWTMNKTFLPSTDENWFNGHESPSCFLPMDPSSRWRDLTRCGNKSATSWFIVVNSLMWEACKMGVVPQVWALRLGFNVSEAGEDELPEHTRSLQKMRDLLDNCLHCTYMNLPAELYTESRFLSFRSTPYNSANSNRFMDAGRYSIHIMFQLTRFMLYSREVYHGTITNKQCEREGSAPPIGGEESRSSSAAATPSAGGAAIPTNTATQENAAGRQLWGRYVDASNLVADVMRNSSPVHFQFVNPFIANTIWFAAAALVVARLFGPQSVDRRLAVSNFDLLTGNLSKYETFWGIPAVLKQKLNNLEEQITAMRRGGGGTTTKPPVATTVAAALSTPNQLIPALLSGGNITSSMEMAPSNTASDLDGGSTDLATKVNASVPPLLVPTLSADGTDLVQQGLNWDSPSAFTGGQFDMMQQQSNMYDVFFDSNPTWANGGLNFNDLFMYPYQ